VLQKEDTDWVKIRMEYEVEGSRPRGRPRGHGERLCKKIAKHTGRMLWIVVDGIS